LSLNKLHIVSMDVPWPADYGGVIDVYYKVKSLFEAGCEVYLHCYEYGRAHAAELKKYCKEVYYYTRPAGFRNISFTRPYIVYSRRNNDLVKNLAATEAPILFEGIHTTLCIGDPAIKGRFKAIRTHNIEHEYYAQLAESKSAGLLRTYYRREVGLLRKYEQSLYDADAFLAISLTDSDWFRNQYPQKNNLFIPPFHPFDKIDSVPGTGDYCLYHGNLSHPENLDAALFLLSDVVPHTKARFVMAGMKPPQELAEACAKAGCKLVADPDKKTMDELISAAHVNVLPTFQRSGMKLKLVTALYGGRHVLVNEPMLHGTGLNNACEIADNAARFIDKINELMARPFTETDRDNRAKLLQPYDKAANAKTLINTMSAERG